MQIKYHEALVMDGEAIGTVLPTNEKVIRVFHSPKPGTSIPTSTMYGLAFIAQDGLNPLPLFVTSTWLQNVSQRDLRIAYSRLVLFYYVQENTLKRNIYDL